MSKCACVYATSSNTSSVRSGHEVGGYLKEECGACKSARAPKPSANATLTDKKVIFEKTYDGESIVDMGRDMDEAFDSRFNAIIATIPNMPDSPDFWDGNFKVTIEWTKE